MNIPPYWRDYRGGHGYKLDQIIHYTQELNPVQTHAGNCLSGLNLSLLDLGFSVLFYVCYLSV